MLHNFFSLVLSGLVFPQPTLRLFPSLTLCCCEVLKTHKENKKSQSKSAIKTKQKKHYFFKMKLTQKKIKKYIFYYIAVFLLFLCHMKPMLLLVSQRFFASNLQHRTKQEITDPLRTQHFS